MLRVVLSLGAVFFCPKQSRGAVFVGTAFVVSARFVMELGGQESLSF